MGGELGTLDYVQRSLMVSWHKINKINKYIYLYIYIYIHTHTHVCWAQQVGMDPPEVKDLVVAVIHDPRR